MMNKRKILVLILVALSIGLASVSCCPGGEESVLIQGAVTIGPIQPVETPGSNQNVPPEVFSSRHLVVYDESGKRLVREVYFTQIGTGNTGYYTAQIAPGTYVVDINHTGIDRADGLPRTVTVVSDETITIDVNIDTGIR